MAVYNKPLLNQKISERHRGVFQNNIMLNSFYDALSVNELIQEAERLKINRNITTSTQVLQIAQEKMYKKKEKRLELLLKYPMYLQQAGQEYSGWMEFLKIKQLFYEYEQDGYITTAELLFAESKISNIMSLFQERKKEFGSAIYYTIRSYIEQLCFLNQIIKQQKIQESLCKDESQLVNLVDIRKQAENYYKIKKAPFQYISIIANLLVKINCIAALENCNKLIQETLLDIPEIDYLVLEEKVNNIMIGYI